MAAFDTVETAAAPPQPNDLLAMLERLRGGGQAVPQGPPGIGSEAAPEPPSPQALLAAEIQKAEQEAAMKKAALEAQASQLLKDLQVPVESQLPPELVDPQKFRDKRWNEQWGSSTRGFKGKAGLFLIDALRGLSRQPTLEEQVRATADQDRQELLKTQLGQLQAQRQAKTLQYQQLAQAANAIDPLDFIKQRVALAGQTKPSTEPSQQLKVVEGPDGKPTLASFNPKTQELTFLDTAKPVTKEPTKTSMQSMDKLVNGVRTTVSFDPKENKYYLPGTTQEVKVEPLPPRELFNQIDPKKVETVLPTLADKVASGELRYSEALSTLGGVRGGYGADLATAVANSRIVPPAVRQKLTDVYTSMNQIDQIERLVNDVVAARKSGDVTEEAKASKLLNDYGEAIGARLSRAQGEVGVLTDQDVKRATRLLPGWKGANFAPDYAKREIALLRETLKATEQAYREQYFQKTPTPSEVHKATQTPASTLSATKVLDDFLKRKK